MIPKGRKEYRGIEIVEVMWKVVAAILHRNRSGGQLGMQTEHLKGWLAASKRGKRAVDKGEEKLEEEEEGGEQWENLVYLIQTAFREGKMTEDAT